MSREICIDYLRLLFVIRSVDSWHICLSHDEIYGLYFILMV